MSTVRTYLDSDLDRVVEVWRRALPLDALTRDGFVRRVLLDENFEREGLLIAESDEGDAVGVALCLVLRHPIEKIGLMEARGFITALGVLPEHRGRGAGSALLEAAFGFFNARGRREVTIAPYAPGYFVPGVDKAAYAEGFAWLERRGFREYSEAIAMDAMIGSFELDEAVRAKEEALAAEGLTVRALDWAEAASFLDFMSETMPGDWVEDARCLLQDMVEGSAPRDSIFVAVAGERVIGYCKFRGEHFGPFGVADSHQGRGIGSVLLARTLLQMRMEGHHAAFVLWTGERAARGVYARLGFSVSRRFAILKRELA